MLLRRLWPLLQKKKNSWGRLGRRHFEILRFSFNFLIIIKINYTRFQIFTQQIFTYSKPTIETLEEGVKYVQCSERHQKTSSCFRVFFVNISIVDIEHLFVRWVVSDQCLTSVTSESIKKTETFFYFYFTLGLKNKKF